MAGTLQSFRRRELGPQGLWPSQAEEPDLREAGGPSATLALASAPGRQEEASSVAADPLAWEEQRVEDQMSSPPPEC